MEIILTDPADKTRCSSLLNHGSWLDSERTHWQPKGCMLRTYDIQHITTCMSGSRVVVIGDSVARQLYYAIVKKVLPDANTEGNRHSDIYFQDPTSGTSFEFYWDPVLNMTKTASLLTGSSNRVLGKEVQTPTIFLVGSGLWYLRYPEWSGGVERWQQVMENLVRQMGSSRLEPLARHLFISPIPTVNTEKLSEERLHTLLPVDIDNMNNYLRDATKDTPVSVPFSWNKMREAAGNQTNDGLHYVEKVVTVEADVLLNYVCNNRVPKIAPMSATCCYSYPSNHWYQTLMLAIFLIWLPVGYILQTYYHGHPVSRFFPSVGILHSFAVVAAAVMYMYYADRTSLFAKGSKMFSAPSSIYLVFLCLMAGSMTLKRSEKDQAFLNRDQTDEWKGWMQVMILIYHYVGASSISAIYNPVRMLVASYLFMTGFGHFVFYYKKADFGFNRVASILVRLNLLTILLAYTMNTDYLAYYFAPLVSFFYLVIYGMMYIGHSHNHNPLFILSKILVTSILTATAIHRPLVLGSMFKLLHFVFGVTWSAAEWRFRLQLDVWIVFIGALFAYGFTKAQEVSITTHPQWSVIRKTSIIASAIGLLGYFSFAASIQKFEYNHWHPYISWIPILSFVVLRNSTAPLRNTVSTFYTFVGKCSLETFICQFHMWLAADTKGILVISPWVEGVGAWTINLALSTFLFFTIAHVLSGATGELSDWLITGREPKPKGRPAVQTVPLTVVTNTSDKEYESGAGLPVAVKRQSVMVSPIAASAGAVGPATLKSLMEASLELGESNAITSQAGRMGQKIEVQLPNDHSKGTKTGQSPTSAFGKSSDSGSRDDRTQDGVVLQIDASRVGRVRSGGVVASAAPPSADAFKRLWMQPGWKVAIFFTVIWVLNYGST
ncbi:hypothetical protein BGZ54_002471 [Gamsiella multidivaricata]|nr:hypothetical protein BGZ54_002471 [Gamsiella multidivaricata]